MESWNQGIMESWNHGIMESWNHGVEAKLGDLGISFDNDILLFDVIFDISNFDSFITVT